MNTHLRAIADTALPSLRVIGMAYTGLIGVGAMALVVSVAFLPVTPALQQATQPAREAVVNFIQPATDAVTSLVAARTVAPEPVGPFVPAPLVALASAQVTDDVIPEDAPVASVSSLSVAVAAPRPQWAPPVALAKVDVTRSVDVSGTAAVAADDVAPDEPVQAVDIAVHAPVQQVVEAVADGPVQQAANAEPPRPLRPVPTPPETAVQLKARLDLENQAAIDGARATAVRRKAEDDAANQTAIDARKAATVAAKAPAHTAPAVAIPTSQLAPATPAPAAAAAASAPTSPPATIAPLTAPAPLGTDVVQKQTVRQTPSNRVVDDQSQQDEAPMMLAFDAP